MTRPFLRRRLAAGAVLTTALVTGCASEVPPEPQGPDVVPTTLAPKPTVKPQEKPELVVATPRTLLYGAGQGSADLVWKQAQEFVSDWLLNPDLMQKQHITSERALDGLTRIMTKEAGARWRKTAHRALRGYVHPYAGWAQEKVELELPVNQLVTFNLLIRSDRGWDNPMMSTIRIDEGSILSGGDAIATIMPIRTRLRFIGQGKRYTVASRTAIGLTWRYEDGAWKIDEWWRTYRLDPEKLRGWRPGQAPPTDPATGGSAPADPEAPSADPTLYPE